MLKVEQVEPDRATLVARWFELTREVLPAMAAERRWPIHLDHCFMRVCLDTAFGSPWTKRLARPAVRAASYCQLQAAIAVAEAIVGDPACIHALNDASLRGRRLRRAKQTAA